eukprot:scaffold8087_cov141-Skeletonema_marinoi.AAC.8
MLCWMPVLSAAQEEIKEVCVCGAKNEGFNLVQNPNPMQLNRPLRRSTLLTSPVHYPKKQDNKNENNGRSLMFPPNAPNSLCGTGLCLGGTDRIITSGREMTHPE